MFSFCIKFSCWSSIRNSYHNPRRFFFTLLYVENQCGIPCWSSRLVHSQCSHKTIAKKHANHFLVQVQLRIRNTVKYNEAILIYIILSQEVFFLHYCMQKISVGFLVEVQLSVHFTYKYTNAIITNNSIQHTYKRNLMENYYSLPVPPAHAQRVSITWSVKVQVVFHLCEYSIHRKFTNKERC